ncbi:MAG: ROK family protein [Spirochaetaceae bacterium]|nr:ROK family protein [Spirochaetaceae bacterium]
MIAAIEAGGTKFVCGLLKADCTDYSAPTILARTSIPTTTPAETLAAVAAFFAAESRERGGVDIAGVGCFGPVDLHPASPGWGRITSTPKPGWSGADVAGTLRDALGVPLAFDTDVNAAAYGEFLWGAARGLKNFIYLTVGTGIGGGVFSGGDLVHGLSHPELGHVKLARLPEDAYEGGCPYHKDCLEGLASGPAIEKRWGRPGMELPPGHPAWELEARYLARAVAAYALVLSPERVLLGGGVGMRPGLAERVSVLAGEELAGYLPPLTDPERLSGYVRRPALGADAGLIGAAALALRLCDE